MEVASKFARVFELARGGLHGRRLLMNGLLQASGEVLNEEFLNRGLLRKEVLRMKKYPYAISKIDFRQLA